jgi:hypothetical protein
LDICDGPRRELGDEARDDIEFERMWDPSASEAVGLRVAENEELSNAIGRSGRWWWKWKWE